MAWSTAVSDLRTLLSDQGIDRYVYRKRCFGDINGTNVAFKTFEPRRVTNFQDGSAVSPLGVYVGGVLQANTAFSSDDVITGEFRFVTAPTDTGQKIEATYYFQWFEDSELEGFLTLAAGWLQVYGTDYTQIPPGINNAALYYAAKLAMEKMAMRWALRASNAFLLEDAPKKESNSISETYAKMAVDYAKSATEYRDDFYTKSGQSLAAFSTSNWGRVSGVTPRR